MAEWIDVNDRLPDSDRFVWVTVYGSVQVDFYDPDYDVWDRYNNAITAWMEIGEMPEPYKPAKGAKHNEEE